MCYILNDREHLDKFDSKSDQGMFLGYSNNSRAYRVYNIRTQTIMESTNIVVDDHIDFSEFSKKEAINSFTDETVVESILHKEVEALIVSVATTIGCRQSSDKKLVTT